MKRITFILMAFMCLLPMATSQAQTAILGYSDIGTVRLVNLAGAVLDSAVRTGASNDFAYEVTVLSKSGTWATVKFTDITRQRYFTRSVSEGTSRTDIIDNFRLVFNTTLTAGDKCRVNYSHLLTAKADSTGALREALWDVARSDSLQNLKATARSILLNNDFPNGLTVVANVNLQFRTNRITNWVFLFAGGSIYIPIRHTAADTFYAKTATIPDVCIIRGK